MLVKTSDLIGPALDWTVAKAERVTLSEASWRYQLEAHGCIVTPQKRELRYSTDWSQGGPLIEKYRIEFSINEDTYEVGASLLAWRSFGKSHRTRWSKGSSHLIAACRAIVAAKLGDQVDVPDELMQS